MKKVMLFLSLIGMQKIFYGTNSNSNKNSEVVDVQKIPGNAVKQGKQDRCSWKNDKGGTLTCYYYNNGEGCKIPYSVNDLKNKIAVNVMGTKKMCNRHGCTMNYNNAYLVKGSSTTPFSQIQGDYWQSCYQCTFENGTLSCTCDAGGGKTNRSSLSINFQQPAPMVKNKNGNLIGSYSTTPFSIQGDYWQSCYQCTLSSPDTNGMQTLSCTCDAGGGKTNQSSVQLNTKITYKVNNNHGNLSVVYNIQSLQKEFPNLQKFTILSYDGNIMLFSNLQYMQVPINQLSSINSIKGTQIKGAFSESCHNITLVSGFISAICSGPWPYTIGYKNPLYSSNNSIGYYDSYIKYDPNKSIVNNQGILAYGK